MPSSSHQLFPKKNPWHPRLAHGFSANQRVWAHLPAANGLKSPSKPVACWWQTNLHQRNSTWLAVIYRVLNKYVALKHHNVLDLPGATGLDHHYLLDTCGGKPRCRLDLCIFILPIKNILAPVSQANNSAKEKSNLVTYSGCKIQWQHFMC